MPRLKMVRLIAIVLICLPSLINSQVARGQSASSASADPSYAPLVDSVESDYLQSTADLARYGVSAALTPAGPTRDARIKGKLTIDYQNQTGGELDEIFLRLYANAPEYSEGGITVERIRVDGKAVVSSLGENETVLALSLNQSVEPGADLRLSMTFETVVPTDPVQSYGMFKFDTASSTYALAHWLPLLAGWDSKYGWNLDPVSRNGDPVFTEAAVFQVRLTAPDDLEFITSGSLLKRSSDNGLTASRFSSGPSRDFVMTASAGFEVVEEIVGEITVRSWYWPGYEQAAERVLQQGVDALEVYSELVGPYPYEELDLVQVDIGNGAGGVEFPGMVYIGADFYDEFFTGDNDLSGFLEFVVVHEVAHQWFYNVVGNNQYQHAFLDESLVNYLSIVYYASMYGADEADHQANLQIRLSYFDKLFQEGDDVVDQPTDDFATMRDYGIIVYGKGALAFMELRREIGADAFFGALQQYYREFAFKIAQPEDLKRTFEEHSGRDLDAFWTHWFEQAAGLEDFDATDLARVLRDLDE